MVFFTFAAELISKLVISMGSRSLGDKLKDARSQRRMARLVDDAVDRIVEQIDEYLRAEKVSDHRKEILIATLCARLQPLANDPQQFFAGNLDGAMIFKRCHPNGELPQEIREEELEQIYSVLFPQIAHFLAGSRIALSQWQAEGFREEFKRLSQIAEEIRAMSAKVADIPEVVVGALVDKTGQEAEMLLREFGQTLLNHLLLRLDLSPLRAERSLYGAMGDHFVIPAFCARTEESETIGDQDSILKSLTPPGARRIIYGGAGVGKTTCALWLQSRLLQSDPNRLAVVLRLREVPEIDKKSLLEVLRERAGTHLRDGLTDKLLKVWHSSGRLVVIFDGFDEVPEGRRDAIQKWIQGLAVVAKETGLLVTSRPIQSDHLQSFGEPWQHWDLLPFDVARIVEFIARWHRYLPEGELSEVERNVEAAALAQTFFNDPSLKPLADTPLMLGTLLFVHHRDKKLPSGRVDLYERYIAAMLGLRDSGLGINARSTKLTDKEKRRVLAHIALHFHLQQVNEVNDDSMRQLVTEALTNFRLGEDVERLLLALCERTGLLLGPGTWSFMHKTIGEFLVAELVCDGTVRLPDKRRLDRKELWSHRHEDSWTAVLFFWAGKATPRELEEFVGDLLAEQQSEATRLALALLLDQGDRLAYETRRTFAVQLVRSHWPSSDDLFLTHGRYTPWVPRPFYVEDHAKTFYLRGLSRADSKHALDELFRQGLLTTADVNGSDESARAAMTLVAINQSGVAWMKRGLRDELNQIPAGNLALHCFFSLIFGAKSLEKARVALNGWLVAFPEARGWVPFLLISSLLEASDAVNLLGPMLWEWHLEPLAEDWLCASSECRSHDESEEPRDLILDARQSLLANGAKPWGIGDQQYIDLLAWCDRALARREEMKMATLLPEGISALPFRRSSDGLQPRAAGEQDR